MIGKLKGILESIDKDYLIIDVNNVGYIVYTTSKIIQSLSVGQYVSFIIETQVREDSINLYGFQSVSERDLFRQLITVKAVGSKLALTILGYLSPDKLSAAINVGDISTIKSVPGLGQKLAERIITELKNKTTLISQINPYKNNDADNIAINNVVFDSVSALSNLGYNKTEAFTICNKLFSENNHLSLSELIKESLKEFSK